MNRTMTRRTKQTTWLLLVASVVSGAVVTLAAGVLAPGSASASGFLVARFGGEQGHPTTDDPSAIYYNPAGLALRPGRLRLYLNGVLAWRMASYQRLEAAIDTPVEPAMNGMGPPWTASGTPRPDIGVNAGTARLTNLIASPFIAVTSDLGVKNLGLGLALYAPFGGSAIWDKNATYERSAAYPGAVDGVQRWSTIDGSVRSLYITAAGAYQIPSAHLSFGVGVNVVMNSLETVRARTSTGTDDVVTSAGDVQEGRSYLSVKNTTLAVGAGLIWQPLPSLHIGASYQSQPGFGEDRLKGQLRTKLTANDTGAPSDVELLQSLPDVVRLGLRYRSRDSYAAAGGAFELRLFAEYVRWSVFNRQCFIAPGGNCALKSDGSLDTANGGKDVILNIPRNWQDGWGVRAGASWFANRNIELFLGAGFDSNAVPDSTLDPSFYDMNKLTFSAGARGVMVKDRLALALTYTQVVYLDRDIPTQKTAMFMSPSKNPDNMGKYSQMIGLASLSLEYLFL